jgi:transcriptional regulator GlxA family with amidase domain
VPFFERGSNFSNKIDRHSAVGQKIFTLLTEIEEEYKSQAHGFQLMIKAKLLAIFTYLVRYYQDEAKSSLTPAQKNKRLEQLQVVFEHIGRNLDQSLLLEDLAALVYMTPSYFCTFFKRATGQTPVQYIHKVRVARAIDLLRTTDQGIYDIAIDSGFANLANFNRIFKRVTGQTPSAVRLS